MSDRKYRQPGYQDRGSEQRPEKSAHRPKENLGGPRAMQMPGTRAVTRCAQCGVVLHALTEPLGNCSQCGFPLHSCKMCVHFDSASRFECRQPVPERIPKKDAHNQCTYFSLAQRVERETSTGTQRVEDARRAFENLFKK